ncbi:MAG: zf-HC2 domain-containing protein [Bryobacterales bacterium]|nr:zf-HC2 domain-containing protein [Bryobacterales bacterium]
MTPPELDRLARQYLLGRLPEAGRIAFGERLFDEETTFETVQAVEMELRDAYARNELSPADRADFEHHLLRTDRQRNASRVSSALAQVIPHRPAKPQRPWTQWALVAAAAIAIPAAFYAAYLQQQLLHLKTAPIARTQPANASMPALVSLFLPDLVLRSNAAPPQLRLPAGHALVKLEIETAHPGPFTATLTGPSGAELLRQSALTPNDKLLTLWLPSSALPSATLQLRLTAPGLDETRQLLIIR